MTQTADLDLMCINTIRTLAMDAVQKAASGHPGLPMGAAATAYVLWTRFLQHNPANPEWPDRDRFVLSAGHGSMLLYSLLHLTGYDFSLDEIKNFRQWGSRAPGHPESFATPGVETTTGPLGQGFGNAVGLAIAERFLAARFNRPGHAIVDHFTYVLCSDGDLMEGLSHEAASLAGHLKLGKLIALYDDNRISIEGPTDLAFSEDRIKRFEAYGWHVQRVEDGNDIAAIDSAIRAAREDDRPSLIAIRTRIGFGSPGKQGTASAHGEPLGDEELRLTKERLGWPLEPDFFIPDQALEHFRKAHARGHELEQEWKARLQAYEDAFPDQARQWRQWMSKELPRAWVDELPVFPPDAQGMATRKASGRILNQLASRLGNLIGGSADLAPSTKTLLEGQGDFQAGQYEGRNLHFGVREHGMGAIVNGLALHGGLIPYGATFLIFSDYMRPPIRLAAMMGLKAVFVFTHDSIGLGEDGPTHQPVEQLIALRAIPGLTVFRPGDANETVQAWRFALEQGDGPVAICLTRQSLPTLDREIFASAEGLVRGAYVLCDFNVQRIPELIFIATGSELHIALEAAGRLRDRGIAVRVVSMPSMELFEQQPRSYRNKVLSPGVSARIAVEAGSPFGWRRFVGEKGEVIGIDHFGASAPYERVYREFGLNAEHVLEKALGLLERS